MTFVKSFVAEEMVMIMQHTSVLLTECIDMLQIKPDGLYVDATLGLGGHTQAIVSKLTTGRMLCFDQDPMAIEEASRRLEPWRDKITYVYLNFRHMESQVKALDTRGADGVLFDLGVSSPQLDIPERGFSFRFDSRLDMRMDTHQQFDAHILVNSWSKEQITTVLRDYGEERYAERVAYRIVRAREKKPIDTTGELVDIVKSALPAKSLRESQHPAMRTFQGIRIAVNDEIESLRSGLEAAIRSTRKGGRIAVISFHSLEDRLVKTCFQHYSNGCTCPPDFPICVCGFKPTVKVITRQPITETSDNRRARSAKLRVAEIL